VVFFFKTVPKFRGGENKGIALIHKMRKTASELRFTRFKRLKRNTVFAQKMAWCPTSIGSSKEKTCLTQAGPLSPTKFLLTSYILVLLGCTVLFLLSGY
jgi:hypothetical protein